MLSDKDSTIQYSLIMSKSHLYKVKHYWSRIRKPAMIVGKILEWGIFALLIVTFFVVLSPFLPTKDKFVTYIVSTASMEPVIQSGSVALVQPIKAEQVKKGDIVTFTSPEDPKKTVIHRIYDLRKIKTGYEFKTKGDNNNGIDAWIVPGSSINGKYILSIPLLGHPAAMLRTKHGFALLVGIPALFLFILQFRKIREGIEEEIQKRTHKAVEELKKQQEKQIKALAIFIMVSILGLYLGGVSIAKAMLSSSITLSGSSFSTKDFAAPPTPTLLSPADNSIKNTTGLVFDWTDETDYGNMNNPVYYVFQLGTDFGFGTISYTSGNLSTSQINAPAVVDGEYWWRVKACDAINNCSAWTSGWKITIDTTLPTAPNWISPVDAAATRQTQNILIDWSDSTDVNLDGYELEIRKVGGSTWQTVVGCGLLTQSQLPNSQIGPAGTCLIMNATELTSDGQYYRRVRAKDAAGNYSVWSSEYVITRDTVAPTSAASAFGSAYIAGPTFNVAYTANDSGAGVKNVKLYYRKDGGVWTLYGTFTSSPISFTSVGDGQYDFYTVAEDAADDLTSAHMTDGSTGDNGVGNVESKLPVVEASVIVDSVAPTVALQLSNSWTKAVEEKISNGDLETGDTTGWTTAGNVSVVNSDTITSPSTTVTPYDGTYMARIGHVDGSAGNYVWENRLMQSYDSGAKSMSLFYNFYSRDAAPYDDPGFFIRVNGKEVLKVNTTTVNPSAINDGVARSTGWNEFYYDLSSHTDAKVNLAIYAGNTTDKLNQSWVYIDKVTSYFVSAPAAAAYLLSGSDNVGGSGINHFEFNVDGAGWTSGAVFSIPAGGIHTLQYRSVDNAGNYSATNTVRVITDTIAPNTISDLAMASKTTNKVTLRWTAPANDSGSTSGKASTYDVRYSTSLIDSSNFDSATKVENVSAPKSYGQSETLEIQGLNPSTTYYFAIKSSDEAPNTSDISNVLSVTTDATAATVSAGDIVINELMWSGTSASGSDQFIELRNMTNRTIDLTGFSLKKKSGGSDVDMGIDFTGKSISPNGYFLITDGNSYGGGDSQIKDTITPDITDADLDLSTTELQIKLYDASIVLIDTAWDGTAPTEGIATGGTYYSMERTSVPGRGTNTLTWYTCIDEASTTDFFDGGTDERGTPGAVNRSENEPLAHQQEASRTPTPTETVTPTASPSATMMPTPTTDEVSITPLPTEQTVSPTTGVTVTPTVTTQPTTAVTSSPTQEPTPETIVSSSPSPIP
jgi:signal peptidase I